MQICYSMRMCKNTELKEVIPRSNVHSIPQQNVKVISGSNLLSTFFIAQNYFHSSPVIKSPTNSNTQIKKIIDIVQ